MLNRVHLAERDRFVPKLASSGADSMPTSERALRIRPVEGGFHLGLQAVLITDNRGDILYRVVLPPGAAAARAGAGRSLGIAP